MKTLNQDLFNAVYNWIIADNGRPHIYCYGENLVQSPPLFAHVRKVEGHPTLTTILFNISPNSCALEQTDDYLIIRMRSGGKHCEEFIPWESIWMIVDQDNPSAQIGLPQWKVLTKEELKTVELQLETHEPAPDKKPSKPKFGVIKGGKE